MANPKYVLLFNEGFTAGLSDSAKRFNNRFGKEYNIVLFSEARKTRFYKEMPPLEAAKRIVRKNSPEIALYELLGDYLANCFDAKENGRKACFISKSEDYDNACRSLYGNDMKFVRLNGKPEETKENLDALFE
ncbi:MAG: hypothetical protein WA139_03365 [Candidatus Aenigmatarchaeota archaeon]